MADSATVVGTASQTLLALALCGVMGLIGQSARAIVGLKSPSSTAPSGQREPFNPTYLAFSLMIGAVAGIVAGILTGLEKFTEAVTLQNMLSIAAAGYAGADFIENAISVFIPKTGGSVPTPPPAAAATPPAAPVPAAAPAPMAATTPAPTPATVRPALVPPVSNPLLALAPNLVRHAPLAPAEARASGPAIASDQDFAASLQAISPALDITIWGPALLAAFETYGFTTDQRRAAAVGQFLVETNPDFADLEEDLFYTHSAVVMSVFGACFRDESEAENYLRDSRKLANKVYADRLGNGDEQSGDGYRYRGRGLIQITGKANYASFADTVGRSVEEASSYCGTPEGAAMSGCWYLWSRKCLPAADAWDIAAITRIVNGKRMLGLSKRTAYSNAMLRHLQTGEERVA